MRIFISYHVLIEQKSLYFYFYNNELKTFNLQSNVDQQPNSLLVNLILVYETKMREPRLPSIRGA
jgi:hypothetical protein